MIDIGLSLTNRIAGGAMYKAVTSFIQSMFASINSRDGLLTDVTLHGLSTQAGTPTPDVPVPIVSTTGNVTVQSENKNLVKITRPTSTISGVTFTVNTDGTITANGTASANFTVFKTSSVDAFYIPIYAGTTYTLSGLLGSAVFTYYTESVVFNTDNTQTYYSALAAPLTFTPSKNGMAKVQVVIRSGVTATNLIFKPQLEVSPAVTSFEKNTTSTQTLPLGTTQLRSLPNGVSDRIYKDGSTWKLEQNVATITLNGTHGAWTVGTTGATTQRFDKPILVDGVGSNALDVISRSDRFSTTNFNDSSDTEHIRTSTSGFPTTVVIFINQARLTANTSAALNTWLSINPVVVDYLRTPMTTTITDPTLITALENIRTYQGITNITASTPISGKYYLL